MEPTLYIADEIESRIGEVVETWRGSVPLDPNVEASELLRKDIERVTRVFVEFLRSPETIGTFSRGGATQALVREICAHQHNLGRDAVGVIEDFAVLRRAIFRTVEHHVDFEGMNGADVAVFFGKMVAASDWVTSAALEAFEDAERERMREALGQAAATDLVTGLPNVDLFNRLLLPNVAASADSFAVAIFDVANFSETVAQGKVKKARRTIQRLAEVVRDAAPSDAVCARFGDDEVCVVLPEGTAEAAYRLSEVVLERIGDHKQSFEVDVGVSEYPTHGESGGAVLTAAVEALRMAKRLGGGGIMVAH